MAVAERRGTATFFKNLSDDSSGSLSSLFTQKHETRAETVETISRAEYFRARGIGDALVKVDVEGAGEKVWDGAVETSKAIRYLVMEMLAPEIEAGLSARIIGETDLKAYYIAKRTHGPPVGNRLPRPQGRLMQGGCRCFALVGDAFGVRGGKGRRCAPMFDRIPGLP
jgi:hypothetical protein